MKKGILWLTLLVMMLSFSLVQAEEERTARGWVEDRLLNILGVWTGSYLGSETDAKGNALYRYNTIRIRGVDVNTGDFYGVFEYSIPGFRNDLFGSYYFKGKVDKINLTYSLQGYKMKVDEGYYQHETYTAYDGKFNLENGTMQSYKFNFVLTKSSFAESRINPDNVIGTYVGQHFGNKGGISVLRNSQVTITSVSNTGIASGAFEISRRENEANQIQGKYRWEGYIDLVDGHIEFQGKEWTVYPDVPDNYVFQKYDGTLDVTTGIMEGNNGNGKFHYQRQANPDPYVFYIDDYLVLHTENGHRYRVFEYPEGNWAFAKYFCEQLGGHLATINSAEENAKVFNYLKMLGRDSAYFGLTDDKIEGVWQWVTGEPYSYSNWAASEPNSEYGNEDYGMFYYKYPTGQWNDGDFGVTTVGKHKAFICEWELGSAPAWKLKLPANLKIIDVEAFLSSPARAVRLPWGCTSIAPRAFANSSLIAIYIPNTVSYISPDAFTKYTVIFTTKGSYAATWGMANGFPVIAD